MASSEIECTFCHFGFSDESSLCPHCGRPAANYVNVSRAANPVEKEALRRRRNAAFKDASLRGCEIVLHDFETATASSRAALARPGHVVQRIVTSDRQIYGTFYDELHAGLRLPEGNNWDTLRSHADTELFGEVAKHRIRFAALTLDETGLFNYGDHIMFFREDMIAHRTTVFEANSALFVEHHRQTSGSPNLPQGYRAVWEERSALCAAKLNPRLLPDTKQEEFGGILLKPGKTSVDDDFVEVHICGPVTVRTLERVVVRKRPPRTGRNSSRKQLEEALGKYGVPLEETR